jgi:hypothetical protein
MSRGLAVVLACGLWVAVPVVLAAGCGDDDSDEHDPGDHDDEHGDHDHSKPVGPPSEAECPNPDESDLTYDNFAKGFFSEYCNRCHSADVKGDKRMNAPADHNFDTLEQIELLQDHIDQMAAAGKKTNTTMPPSDPKPSLEDRKKLGEWIACGLKE